MRPSASLRFALALPVGSVRAIVAATQVVIFLVRDLGKTELDLSERGAELPSAGRRPRAGAILLAAVVVERPPEDALPRTDLERQVRERIERAYARQGITPVHYDLQVV